MPNSCCMVDLFAMKVGLELILVVQTSLTPSVSLPIQPLSSPHPIPANSHARQPSPHSLCSHPTQLLTSSPKGGLAQLPHSPISQFAPPSPSPTQP